MTTLGPLYAKPPRARGIFCNRTLNMRTIKAVGFDMDYTLIHYHVDQWELRAYEHLRRRLAAQGLPTADLKFDPTFISRGLIIDAELGNIVKANRFGYVKRAAHGTRMLDFEEQRSVYSRVLVDLSERRWSFLNTSFALSEGCMYAQLIDLLDARKIDEVIGYEELYQRVRVTMDETHMVGELKAEIMADPEPFVALDPDTPAALLDLKSAGKKLILITNSEWIYTRGMMSYAFDRFMPQGMTWRDIFDVVIVNAGKPGFFERRQSLYEMVNDDGLCRPLIGKMREGGIYLGGNASAVESHFGLAGEEILYVGDHVFADVNVSKSVLRWRTALVARELEAEFEAVDAFKEDQHRLEAMMREKEEVEHELSLVKLEIMRSRAAFTAELRARSEALRAKLMELDGAIAPLAKRGSELVSPRWGLLMRTGNDKSHLAKQVERYADIYTSRVSNFLYHTPFVYLRSPRTSLPHDMD